jgi:hypothetical protein
VSSFERLTLARLATWGFPAVSVGLTVASQVVVPRFLQLGLSEAEYTAYVALTSVAAYVGLGEGGVILSLLKELSSLHGAGDREGFIAELNRSRWIFALAALLGGAIAGGALFSLLAAEQAWPGMKSPGFVLGASALVLAGMLELAFGNFQTALLFSTGRLLAAQIATIATTLLQLAALVGALAVTRSLLVGVLAQASLLMIVAAVRGAHAMWLFRREARGVAVKKPAAPLGRLLGSGALLRLSDVLHNASFPHLLSQLAPAFVPGAIPARTYANAARLVTQQLVNVLQIHVARGLAGDGQAKIAARAQYSAAAMFLTSVQLLQLAFIAAVAPLVFRLWLPNQAPFLAEVLPGLLTWQALLAASVPTEVMLFAGGDIRALGLARLAGIPLGLGTIALSLASLGRLAFGVGLAASSLPIFFYGLWGELGPMRSLGAGPARTAHRYGAALVAAVACAAYRQHPHLVALLTAACGLVGLPASVRSIWRLLRR